MISFEIFFYYFISYLPIILLVFLLLTIKEEFLDIKTKQFSLSDEKIIFEISMPKEITKTPLAMELVFSALYSISGESNWWKRNFLGQRRPYYSLEIVSEGGNIKFYIWTSKKSKKVVESAFYSQYPSVQLVEVLDYTKFHSFDPEKQDFFGVEYKLTKADPYPIKTYKDFGLDKPGLKPEETVDPISHILEVMGNINKGENMWIQFVIRGQKEDSGAEKLGFFDVFKKRKLKEAYNWNEEAKKILDKLRNVKNPEENGLKRIASESEKEIIDSIERNISKPSFWTGIRSIYFSDKGVKYEEGNISAMTSIFNTIKSENLNGLSAGGFVTSFNYPWNDFKNGRRIKKIKKDFFADYKRRKYYKKQGVTNKINPHFFLPFLNKMQKYNDFILSTEELATIFHLPSTVVGTPTFQREESKKGEAPSNLPF